MERNFQAELAEAQKGTKRVGAFRERLLGDQRVEESHVRQGVEALKAMGFPDAETMPAKDLLALADRKQAALATKLTEVHGLIAEADALYAEYLKVAEAS